MLLCTHLQSPKVRKELWMTQSFNTFSPDQMFYQFTPILTSKKWLTHSPHRVALMNSLAAHSLTFCTPAGNAICLCFKCFQCGQTAALDRHAHISVLVLRLWMWTRILRYTGRWNVFNAHAVASPEGLGQIPLLAYICTLYLVALNLRCSF